MFYFQCLFFRLHFCFLFFLVDIMKLTATCLCVVRLTLSESEIESHHPWKKKKNLTLKHNNKRKEKKQFSLPEIICHSEYFYCRAFDSHEQRREKLLPWSSLYLDDSLETAGGGHGAHQRWCMNLIALCRANQDTSGSLGKIECHGLCLWIIYQRPTTDDTRATRQPEQLNSTFFPPSKLIKYNIQQLLRFHLNGHFVMT